MFRSVRNTDTEVASLLCFERVRIQTAFEGAPNSCALCLVLYLAWYDQDNRVQVVVQLWDNVGSLEPVQGTSLAL